MAFIFDTQTICEDNNTKYFISSAWESLVEELEDIISTPEDLVSFLKNPIKYISWDDLLSRYSALNLKLLFSQPWRFPLWSDSFFNKSYFDLKNIRLEVITEDSKSFYKYGKNIIDKRPTLLDDNISNLLDIECRFESLITLEIKRLKEEDSELAKTLFKAVCKSYDKACEELGNSNSNQNMLFNNALLPNKGINKMRLYFFPGRFRNYQDHSLGFSTGIDTENLFSFVYLVGDTSKYSSVNRAKIIQSLVELCFFCQVDKVCPYFHKEHKEEWLELLDFYRPNKPELTALTGSTSLKRLKSGQDRLWEDEFLYERAKNPIKKFILFPEFHFTDSEKRYAYDLTPENLKGKIPIPVQNKEAFVGILKDNALK